MGLYGGGTFRVKGQSFGFYANYESSSSAIIWYDHSADMWNDRIDWDFLKDRFENNGGSEVEAKIIQDGLNYLASPDSELTTEEVDMIQSILKEIPAEGDGSLWSFIGKRHYGEAFEDRLGLFLSRVFDAPLDDILQGRSQTTAPVTMRVTIDTSGRSSQKNVLENMRKIVKEQCNIDYKTLIGAVEAEIESNFGTTETNVIIRSSRRQGKVDIEAPSGMQITAELSPPVEQAMNAMRGHTFSLKNYTGVQSSKGWHLGSTSDFRALSSFYFSASRGNDNNFANTCTFIFSSTNSKNSDTVRFLSWARFLFELTGLGLWDLTNKTTARPVDYLILNKRDVNASMQVIWAGALLKGMPNAAPPPAAIYGKSVSIKT